jgi:small-conductance mechanosensitive channel
MLLQAANEIAKDGTLLRELIYMLIITLGGMVVYQVTFFILKRRARDEKHYIPALLDKYLYFPGFFLITVLTFIAGLPFVRDHVAPRIYSALAHGLRITAIIAVALLIVRAATVFRDITLHRYHEDDPKDFTWRKAKTKFQLLQRMLNTIIIIAAVSAILMTFENVRQVGSTLLASAGVVGLVVGFAAQKSIGTFFAGIQIAISQPIRVDDVVVVEEQFGTIGEITLTYVVVNTWDGRRLIVPINYFLENTFENWTRQSPQVIGKVRLNFDYSLPLDEIREQVKSWIESSPQWDKRKWGFLVTDTTEQTMQVRITVSAANSDDSFDLECMIREKLITYVQKNYPQALPKMRLSLDEMAFKQNGHGDGKPLVQQPR